jgi:UDP-N-acetylmuramoyl-tripeptide--D-alanyl-D-alanine ligase
MKLTWTAEDIIRAVHGQSLHEQTWSATGISIDSRTVKPGDIFVALKGPAHDGHDHVGAAITTGAAAAIVSRQPSHSSSQAPLIMCDDTFVALQQLGKAGRIRAGATIIAVTGSVGKTGTKEMLRLMLSATGDTYANEGSLNNHWGVPLSLARLPMNARYGVFELGMNHAGELTELSQQVQPHVSLITTIEAVHLEFFESVEKIADAKAEIFIGTRADGTAVLNRDNAYYARLATAAKNRGLKKILSFGRDAKADARLIDYTVMDAGAKICAEIQGQKIDYMLSVPGEHIAFNSVGALLAAAGAGSDVEACAAALAHYQVPQGRGAIQSIPMAGGSITLIDESYNASPAAVRSAIRVLGGMNPARGGRRILVLGDMKELGATADELHRNLDADIEAHNIDVFFGCGEMTKHLFDALPAHRRGGYAEDSLRLAMPVAKSLQPNDIVTVKGSFSVKMKIVVEAIKATAAKSITKSA